MHIYVSKSHLHTHHKTSRQKDEREKKRKKKNSKTKREPNNPNLQEFQWYVFHRVHACMHTHMKMKKKLMKAKIAIASPMALNAMHVVQRRGNQWRKLKTKILLHIITLKMHTLIRINKLACTHDNIHTQSHTHTHAHTFTMIRIRKQKHKFAATGVFSEFIFIMPISIFFCLLFFIFWISIFFVFIFTTYQCYLFFCVHKLCENQSKMNSLYFLSVQYQWLWQLTNSWNCYSLWNYLFSMEYKKKNIGLHGIWV